MPPAERLSFAQLLKIARAFTQLGVEKIRITGGEPLLRAAWRTWWSNWRS